MRVVTCHLAQQAYNKLGLQSKISTAGTAETAVRLARRRKKGQSLNQLNPTTCESQNNNEQREM